MRGQALFNEPSPSPPRRGTRRRGLSMSRRSESTPTCGGNCRFGFHIISRSTCLDRKSGTDYDVKILGQSDRAIALAPDYDLPYEAKGVHLAMSRRYYEAIRAANAGLAVNPNDHEFLSDASGSGNVPGPFRPGESDVQQAIRLSPHDPFMTVMTTQFGDMNWLWSSRSRNRRIPKVARRGRSHLLELRKPRRFLCAPGQDGRGEAVRGGNPSRQSELHHQMVSRARGGHSEAYRRPA